MKVGASIGEGQLLREAEWARLLETVVEAARGRVPVIGAISAAAQIGIIVYVTNPLRHGSIMPETLARMADFEKVVAIKWAPPADVDHAERFLHRRIGIRTVQLIEIDVIGLQAAQAVLDRGEDVAPGETSVVRPVTCLAPHFRRQHDIVPATCQRLADDLLRAPPAVDVRRVDEVDPLVEGAMDDAQ